jgi:hypothetical protein
MPRRARRSTRNLGCLMPWKCPACETAIRHDGDAPEPQRLYRCHICRLELALNVATNRLDVPPLPDTASDQPPRRRRNERA